MRRTLSEICILVFVAVLSAISACTDSAGPGGDGGDGGATDADYALPPFKVVQYSTSFEGMSGRIIVGLSGVVLATDIIWGTWVVPTEDRTDLHDVWSRSVDSFFVVGDRGTDGKGVIYRYAGGKRAKMTHPLTGWLTGIHGTSWSRVYAVGSDGGIIR